MRELILFRNPRYSVSQRGALTFFLVISVLFISKVEGGKIETSHLLQWLDIVSEYFCFVRTDSTASVLENNAQLKKDGKNEVRKGFSH